MLISYCFHKCLLKHAACLLACLHIFSTHNVLYLFTEISCMVWWSSWRLWGSSLINFITQIVSFLEQLFLLLTQVFVSLPLSLWYCFYLNLKNFKAVLNFFPILWNLFKKNLLWNEVHMEGYMEKKCIK